MQRANSLKNTLMVGKIEGEKVMTDEKKKKKISRKQTRSGTLGPNYFLLGQVGVRRACLDISQGC